MKPSELQVEQVVGFDYPDKQGNVVKRTVKVLELFDNRFRGESVVTHESRRGTGYGMFSFDKIENLDTVSPFVLSLVELRNQVTGA